RTVAGDLLVPRQPCPEELHQLHEAILPPGGDGMASRIRPAGFHAAARSFMRPLESGAGMGGGPGQAGQLPRTGFPAKRSVMNFIASGWLQTMPVACSANS